MNNNGNQTQATPKANTTGTTRIALVLDRSGSMARVREQARDAFNEAVERVRTEAAKGSGDVSTTRCATSSSTSPPTECASSARTTTCPAA